MNQEYLSHYEENKPFDRLGRIIMTRMNENGDEKEKFDKANERLKRKYHKIASHSKYNIAKTAVARELACFVWGMMTDNIA